MSSLTYKCLHCGSGLSFHPEKQNFYCEYCRSAFTEAELSAGKPTGQGAAEPPPGRTPQTEAAEPQALHYQCPSCGGEVISDDTTAATACVYCHNPVILAGRLSGGWKPDKVVPFAFDKNEVKKRIHEWAKGRWFIDGAFLSAASMENLQGVYFPFWMVEGHAHCELSAAAENIRVWRSGNTEYTEISRYDVHRNGELGFANLSVKALDKESARMVEGVYPYDISKSQDFSMPYLSGFLAEKRNVKQDAAKPAAMDILTRAGRSALFNTVSGYESVSERVYDLSVKDITWRYALLPLWLLTYTYKNERYFFAVNGQTGKVAGRVPADGKKLGLLFLLVTLVCGAVAAAVLGGIS